MTCETALDLIIDSLMSARDEGLDDGLSVHLRSCDSCAAEAERMKLIWEGLGNLSAPDTKPHAAVEFGRRLSAGRRGSRVSPLLRTAAAIALLTLGAAGGYLARGNGVPASTLSEAPRFLLLVRGEPEDPGVAGGLTREYGLWASTLASEGRLIAANKLMDEPGRWLSGEGVEDPRASSDVSGYFLVSAADYGEAVEIARGSPHVKYGGTFEIRRVDPVN